MKTCLLILSTILFAKFSFAQDARVQYFIDRLKDNSKNQVLNRLSVYDSIQKFDSAQQLQLVRKIEDAVKSSSVKMKTRVLAMKARILFYLPSGTFHEDTTQTRLMKQVLYEAYKLDEPYMIAEYSRWYGEMLNDMKKREEAVQYCLNAIRVQESLGLQHFGGLNNFYISLGEMLYRIGHYKEALAYYQKGVVLQSGDTVGKGYFAHALNAMGICYKNTEQYDSSLQLFYKCMEHCKKYNLEDLYYMASDNRFDPFLELKKYDSCRLIADDLYGEGVKTRDDFLIAMGCFMYGRTSLREKQFTDAYKWLNKAHELAEKSGTKRQFVRMYKDLAETCDSLNMTKQAYNFYKYYKYLQDSTDKSGQVINSNYLFAKASFESEQVEFNRLKLKRKKDIKIRNTALIGLALLSMAALWWLNKKRRKALAGRDEAEKQLTLFTHNIIGKDNRIETLQAELEKIGNDKARSEKIDELSRQLILTEDDWLRFQALFNKVHPGFMNRLREKTTGITEAEIRMASLIKIRLNTKQIASMQGISPDSVHKTRQRLRQRFATASTPELESIIAGI